jgi:hypothetical protein
VGGYILMPGSFLLIDIHVAKLSVDLRSKVVSKTHEKSVLIECVVDDSVAEVNEDFVHDRCKWYLRAELFSQATIARGPLSAFQATDPTRKEQ